MGEIINFPVKKNEDRNADIKSDPYYMFLKNVLTTADSCGFKLPFTIESATEHVYKKTRDKSQLARLLRQK